MTLIAGLTFSRGRDDELPNLIGALDAGQRVLDVLDAGVVQPACPRSSACNELPASAGR